MIDIENIVINKVSTSLNAMDNDILIISEEVKIPSSFPAVMITQKTNSIYLDSRDENKENHANIMFQVDIYDNNIENKKETCKMIANKIDLIMQDIGFTRIMCEPISNLEDATIYRIAMRFTAVVSKLMEGDIHYIYDK